MKLILKTFCVLFILVSLLTSCKNNKGNMGEVNQLFEEVMDLHDEVMPKMGDLHYLKKQVKSILNEKKISSELSSQANQIINELVAADEHMMVWMADFEKPSKDEGPEAAKTYLINEKKKMADIKVETIEIINKAESWIEQHKK